MSVQTWLNTWRQRHVYESPNLETTLVRMSRHDRAIVLEGEMRARQRWQQALEHARPPTGGRDAAHPLPPP